MALAWPDPSGLKGVGHSARLCNKLTLEFNAEHGAQSFDTI